MSDATRQPPSEAENNRPYRRTVWIFFALLVAVLCVVVLRGIISHLDRMPSAGALARLGAVDERALIACGEDLATLIKTTRGAAGKAFASGDDADSWTRRHPELELERLSIIARCRLDEPTNDRAAEDLADAAEEIEGMLRSISLVYARHAEDGRVRAMHAQRAIDRAVTALKSRR